MIFFYEEAKLQLRSFLEREQTLSKEIYSGFLFPFSSSRTTPGDSTGVRVKNEDLETSLIWDFSHRVQKKVCERTLKTVCRPARLHLLVVDVRQDAGQDLQQENAQQQGKILQREEREGKVVSGRRWDWRSYAIWWGSVTSSNFSRIIKHFERPEKQNVGVSRGHSVHSISESV